MLTLLVVNFPSLVNAGYLQGLLQFFYNNTKTITCLSLPGIIRDAAASELGDKWFGQQAVYRVSMGNFVSMLVTHNSQIIMVPLGPTNSNDV